MADDEYGDEVTRRLHATDDAQVWAREWCGIATKLSQEKDGFASAIIDEGWMIGWFANAIEVAKAIDRARHPERKPAQDVDYVLLPREALLQFFGRMALPPWRAPSGEWIGGDIDCAPIASEIGEWVEANDLGDLYRKAGS